jgi:hypothetical protein
MRTSAISRINRPPPKELRPRRCRPRPGPTLVCGSIRPTHLALGGDLPGDAVRIATDALDLLRGDRMEELEADEVETGL